MSPDPAEDSAPSSGRTIRTIRAATWILILLGVIAFWWAAGLFAMDWLSF